MQLKLKIKRIKELLAYGLTALKEDGFAQTLRRALGFFKRRFAKKSGRLLPPKKVLEYQRSADTKDLPTISICVPLYNTPPKFLREFINSVTAQTCANWQLCLADASDNDHYEVSDIVSEYKDERILYVKIDNDGISENTNAAATLATGDYIALADHDDILAPHAVYTMATTAKDTGAQFIYSDEALFTRDYHKPMAVHFKPDFAYDYLLCCNYICHFTAIKADVFMEMGGLNPECDGSQDHDLFLRLCEKYTPFHIPRVLYYWRVHANSTSGGTAAKPYVANAAKHALNQHLIRIGASATVTDGLYPSTYKVEYSTQPNPLVSIIIPNKDHIEDLDVAITSVIELTEYKNYEIIIVENNSTEEKTFEYYKQIAEKHKNIQIVYFEGGFNFSAINNFGRKSANGEYLLLLNNDVRVINGGWLTDMLGRCMQDGVGIVGAKLYYPDDTLQHGGVITGLGGYAGHSHKYSKRTSSGYMFRTATVQNFSAVTAACMLVKASIFDEMNGLDEEFTVAFNDVDFCLRVRNAGYRIIYTPYAELYHYESKSRGLDEKDIEKQKRFNKEQARLTKLYGAGLKKDPFYNINLTLDSEDFAESAVLPEYKIQ